ncbi:MAG TPA: bifunctional (p)ppGpp synthetase/guanosine-3',5'-bis(diphosphate) 3'-pyrophosphohydrolase, partial [Candidatus Avibacteroides faecavium]|nr:bifunctional (p)ppGpp synthetase/guanosine-3',5'-bis(diphosphate) 3'-pyrophosphohydrolase [Candidatus Avibacteroides faecavium]
MKASSYFTEDERRLLPALVEQLATACNGCVSDGDYRKVKRALVRAAAAGTMPRNAFGMNPIVTSLQTASIVASEIRNDREAIVAILLHNLVRYGFCDIPAVCAAFGEDVATIISGLIKTNDVYQKSPVIESDNFRDLLMSFASDMRVILIMIADRVNIMRQIRDTENVTAREKVANEAKCLYAPLAHKLGLYKLKTELEDLSVKYLYHDVYYHIKDKLSQTKAARDRYIAKFIEPVEQRLKQSGLKFHIKGRTKSIHSIWNKMKKQNVEFEGIYDLFAIRIIIDSAPEDEKKDCWVAYSIVTDMYPPNPKRLRDWLSVPKSNGYESLHITVMGPEGKWVEVQIRTERMDAIAERGVAAHWRYKGIKSDNEMDSWLTSIREALENNDAADNDELLDQFKVNLYKDDVFIFTPKGDLVRMPKGSTLLDFAFSIHTNVGSHCIGG